MVRIVLRALLLLGLAGATPAFAEAPEKPVDYAAAASWACRPDKEAICETGLDAMVVGADGSRTPQAFQASSDPQIDCFYVYPTASREQTAFADMALTPELEQVVRAQAGRLTSRCRMFAPIYRQLTLMGLKDGTGDRRWGPPYEDVLAAWRWYMAHENKGRGVVLIGHSQGTVLLQRLIADEIDGKPVQARLVSAFLAGDPGLQVPKSKTVGGIFKHVPLCGSAGQTGCVYVWSSYLADDAATGRLFGRNRSESLVAGCVNPAAPDGGKAMLEAYFPRPRMAPESDPPWVELKDQLSAQCVADAEGNVLRVTIEPGRYADLLKGLMARSTVTQGWGLHRVDVSLLQGNILDILAAENQSWSKATH